MEGVLFRCCSEALTLFQLDASKAIRLTPRLTHCHVEPPPIYGKMKVKLAAQTLSHSVATGLKTYASAGMMTKDAIGTANYCDQMDKIFDVLNSSSKFGSTLFKKALTCETQDHLPALIEWIKSIRVVNKGGKDVTNTFHCLDGIVGALKTTSEVLDHLRSTAAFEYLLTRRLCSDPLENFFSIIRQKGGYNSNPSLLSFSQAYKAVIFN